MKYYLGDLIKKTEMGRHIARMGKRGDARRVSVRKPEGRRPLGRLRRRWEYNIKLYP
jgi:hypothetical protein